MSVYRQNGLCKVAGITPRQADHWTTQGWLRPLHIEGSPAQGSGHHRIFDDTEVIVATILGNLAKPEQRAAIVREVVEHGSADLGPAAYMALYREEEAPKFEPPEEAS